MTIFSAIQKAIAPKPAAAPKPPPPPPPPPPRVTVTPRPTTTGFESGTNRAQSWQQFTAAPRPASNPRSGGSTGAAFRLALGTSLASTAASGGRTRTAGPRPSSLLTEGIGDGQSNCLEKAYQAAGPNDSVTLLRDSRDSTGHAVVERSDGKVFDPATQRTFASMEAYLAQNTQYSLRPEPEARRIPRSSLDQVFKTPPGSPERLAALKATGLSGIAQVSVADGGPLTAQEAAEQIKHLLEWDFPAGVSHDDLMEIQSILGRVPPDQVSTVISKLSDDQLSTWAQEINDAGIFGQGPSRGLDSSERGSLFGLLAGNLDATQASRFFQALDRPEQMIEFGDAYIQNADADGRLGFLQSIGNVSFPTSERSGSGRVIAAILDSLTTDPAKLCTAIGSLSEQNLQDGLIAAADPRWNVDGPFGGQIQLYDMDRLQRIVGAVAGTEDYRARAAVFDGLGYMMREVVRGSEPVLHMEEVADQVTGMMTGLISNDLPAILGQLSGASGLDPLGTAFTTYAKEQLRDGGGTLGALSEQLRALDLGAPGPDGRFGNAFLAGYFAGSVFKAVDSLSPADLLGPDAGVPYAIAQLVVAFRTDPATGMLLSMAMSEAERASIDRAMHEGGVAVRDAILQLLGVQISPGNDNGTAVGGFEQGLFAVYGSELYGH